MINDIVPNVSVKFEPRDLWIGVYWKYSQSVESPSKWLTLYVCVMPTLPIILNWHWGWRSLGKAYEAYRQSAWDCGMTAMEYHEWKGKQK